MNDDRIWVKETAGDSEGDDVWVTSQFVERSEIRREVLEAVDELLHRAHHLGTSAPIELRLWTAIGLLRDKKTEKQPDPLRVRIEEGEDGQFVAHCPALRGCVSQGRTQEEAQANLEEAISQYLSALGDAVEFRDAVGDWLKISAETVGAPAIYEEWRAREERIKRAKVKAMLGDGPEGHNTHSGG